ADISSISGRIELLEIRERWNPESEKLRATVTAACHGQIHRRNGSTVTLDLPPVTVSGYSSMEEQLDNAAALISERIRKALTDKTGGFPNKTSEATSGSGHGFE
ncbi:MAG: hypothetical protein GXO34_02790, partial [Deltaproteobacteria bacterium]|nr:hypothetical protein [Deltaproteobacteria bacterium]